MDPQPIPRLHFLGAARNVTGSRYLIEHGTCRVLIDCGLYQERDLRSRNWDPFPVDPKTLDAVVLTHAHLDHVGYLPRLVASGFSGPVHGTGATLEIARIILEDSAHIQQEDAEFKRRRHERESRRGPYPEEALYTVEDAQRTCEHFVPHAYDAAFRIGPLEFTLHDAGHILGSAQIRITFPSGAATRSLLFSGDMGRWNTPILNDPTMHLLADYVVVESTYGTRVHPVTQEIDAQFEAVVNQTVARGGNILIPSFAVERTHEVLYHLNRLLLQDRIPNLMVFVDSPMAVSVTEVFRRHPENFDKEMTLLVEHGTSPFDFPSLQLVRTVEQSKAINRIKGSVIIIAGSGMCTGGRIKHHLANNIGRKSNTVLFVGYQAVGTLGRLIRDGAKKVRIHGYSRHIRARVETVSGLSGHADRNDLMRWLRGFESRPRTTFVTHGEEASALALADLIRTELGAEVLVPEFGASHELT